MFANVRRYRGLSEPTVAALEERAADIAAVLDSVPGTCASHLIRTREGVILVTVGRDEPCLVESGRRFRAWVDDHIRDFRSAEEPDVWSGPVLFQQIGAGPR